jgi:hypothetical protein
MGLDGTYIRKLETGWTPYPGCQTLARLAVALGVPADILLDFHAATLGLELLAASALTLIFRQARLTSVFKSVTPSSQV